MSKPIARPMLGGANSDPLRRVQSSPPGGGNLPPMGLARSSPPGGGNLPPSDIGGDFRSKLKTDADRKLYDSMVKNFGGDFKGLGKNVRTASGNANLTDAQALAQKFKNAQLAQRQAGTPTAAGPTAPKAPVAGPTPPAVKTPAAPTVAAPATTPSTTPFAGLQQAGPSPVVTPASSAATPSMAGLSGALGDVGGGQMLSRPSRFRQGIGQRMPPPLSSAIAGLQRIY